ncbi:hypothetical protein CTEN210_15596 [Chaetoceros tenuissimus]|uniref:Uncharacterized protein n=1 Tax=Chaetoceros tenuissimus TaxID=426638 RepID=A0AAD3HD19_9STRA|nr:hypothetical protein CTEN210_15596 [Chaetoceros tenuissimus]
MKDIISKERFCDVCKVSLPHRLFPKKKFEKDKVNSICRQCSKNITAQRCKQPTQEQKKQGRRSHSGIVRRPNNHGYCNYLDMLFAMNCFQDIVALKAFSSAKDVSESMAALQAACEHGNIGKKDKVKCLAIGDGSTPRTAVLACFIKKWHCSSIDPALHEEWIGNNPKGVRNLVGYGCTLEEFMMEQEADNSAYDHLVLLCVHSHARMIGNTSISKIMARYNNVKTTFVSLPCCPKFRSQKDVGRLPDVQYDDDCVFSDCRRVEVYNFDYANTKCQITNQKT